MQSAPAEIRFAVVRDGTGLLQCVIVKGSVPEEVFNAFDTLARNRR
jgi:aspartyl/asparaginyl-tRNA synthetase